MIPVEAQPVRRRSNAHEIFEFILNRVIDIFEREDIEALNAMNALFVEGRKRWGLTLELTGAARRSVE
jgi:hypothetical protein